MNNEIDYKELYEDIRSVNKTLYKYFMIYYKVKAFINLIESDSIDTNYLINEINNIESRVMNHDSNK